MDIQAFFKVTYGLYLISSMDGESYNGHISNTVFQVSAKPARFAIASHKDNLTTEYIRKSKVFSISVLQEDIDMDFIGPWGFQSGKDIDKFLAVNFKRGKSGVPIVLDKSIAWFECELLEETDTGSHIIFIGKVLDAQLLDDKKLPLTYTYYRDVIKGRSPENAPTYIEREKPGETGLSADTGNGESKKGTPGPAKYKCTVCGYVYDPAQGDPPAGIPPGTPFEEIPGNWTCPVCGVQKIDFKALREN